MNMHSNDGVKVGMRQCPKGSPGFMYFKRRRSRLTEYGWGDPAAPALMPGEVVSRRHRSDWIATPFGLAMTVWKVEVSQCRDLHFGLKFFKRSIAMWRSRTLPPRGPRMMLF